jgi:tetratricopeptide (TPR) repeat protein
MGGRVVYCARLESVCAERYPGFESPPIRQLPFVSRKFSARDRNPIMRWITAFLLLAGTFLANGETVSGALPPSLTAASRHYQDGKFDEATADLDSYEKSSAATVESLDLRGCILLEQQKFEDAQKSFEAAHNADPAIFAPRIHLGDLLLRQKKFEEARKTYQTLLRETNILISHERLRFAVLLTYLGERNEVGARRAVDIITFPTESPAYYYAQAAWAFAHDKKSEGSDWVKKAKKVFDPESSTWFLQNLYQFGWIKDRPPLSIFHG